MTATASAPSRAQEAQHGERRVGVDPASPAKVEGDRDEAKQLCDDVAVEARGGPDADLHHPAAATSVADEEAGADASEPSSGRTEPLRRRGSRPDERPADA